MKINCWEFKKCGREVGGVKSHEMGICPVANETKLNNVHSGKNGGRSCWVVPHSLCGNTVQGDFGSKFQQCIKCDFYLGVKNEEGANFFLSPKLLRILKGKELSASDGAE